MSLTILKSTFYLLTFALLSACGVGNYPSNSKPVSHAIWDSLVRKHVRDNGLVDYRGFIQDSTKLNEYIALVGSAHPNEKNWTRKQRIAYWINVYNANTVLLIIRNYPLKSIKDIKKGIPFINTVWDIKFIHIEGATYDLNNVEHGILRAKYDEPRIHFAVNCASTSCPRLRQEAYQADILDKQLEDQARIFLADKSKNKISANKVKISLIFKWFSGDFTKNETLIEFLNKYAPIKINKDADIDYMVYDWSLNDVKN